MPSSHTPLNRLEMQNPGENDNQWGDILNERTIALIDTALDGWTKFALSGPKTLTEADGEPDEARARVVHVTSGTGGTVTIPAVEKVYMVFNQATGSVTLTVGSGATVVVPTMTAQWVFTDGVNVYTDTVSIDTAIGLELRTAADAAAARLVLELGNAALLNKATTAQTRAASGDAALIADNIKNALEVEGLADASTVAVNWTAGVNFDVSLAGNRTLGNPTNVVEGTTRTIMVKGNSGTARTLSFGSNYKGFLPVLADITSTKFYFLTLFAYASDYILVSVVDGGS
jgi:hypothetical protein